jgi:hypothetical protein
MKHAPTPHVPKEILRSSIIANNLANFEREDHTQRIEELEKQIKQLYDMVKRVLLQFWWVLLKTPMFVLGANPVAFKMGEAGELATTGGLCGH